MTRKFMNTDMNLCEIDGNIYDLRDYDRKMFFAYLDYIDKTKDRDRVSWIKWYETIYNKEVK